MTQPLALILAGELSKSHLNHHVNHAAAAELRRLHAENTAAVSSFLSVDDERTKLRAQRGALLEALVAMEARFGCRSSRAEDPPKTFSCRHVAETCPNCEGLVTGWKAVQAARAAIAAVEGETK